MPPKHVASPGHASGSGNSDDGNDELLAALRAHGQKTRQRVVRQQQAVLSQADNLVKDFKASVKKVLTEEQAAIQKRAADFTTEDQRLKKEIMAVEKELLELLQVEASTIQLSISAVQAELEESNADTRASVETLQKLADQEGKAIDAAVEGLWAVPEKAGEDEPMAVDG
ncbi:hypothetical protein JCM10207_007462 [Rhodosporidiobolus poonsookiae]